MQMGRVFAVVGELYLRNLELEEALIEARAALEARAQNAAPLASADERTENAAQQPPANEDQS